MIDSTAILSRAEALFGTPIADLCGPRRFQRLIPARQAVAWALRRLGLSHLEIGELLGRHHSTVCYAIDQAERRATDDPRYAADLQALIALPLPERRTSLEPPPPPAPSPAWAMTPPLRLALTLYGVAQALAA